MRTSVVVPTRDRPGPLARCLASLARQEASGLELVVVDDGSRDPAATARLVEATPGARLVRAEGTGPAAARNAGIAAAGGEVILLTDDDCEPDPAWAGALAGAAADSPAAGPTVNVAPGAAPAAAQAITSHLRESSRAAGEGAVAFAPTCNLGAPKALLERLAFDESYPLAAGEDREWCARVISGGERIAWVPGAVVRHRHEMGPRAFLRQQMLYGRGAARFRASSPSPASHRPRPSFYAGFVRAGFAEGVAPGLLVCAAQVAAAAGFAAERLGGGDP
jgi:glycosyltransferase involved in cell wall biosynthesis